MANVFTFSKSSWSNALLLGVVGTAVGLNLAVMDLGRAPIGSTEASAEPAVAAAVPEVRQVMVDVPVPTGQVAPIETASTETWQPRTATTGRPPEPAVASPLPVAAPTSPSPSTNPTTAQAAPATTIDPPTTPVTAAPTTAPPTTAPPATDARATEYLTYDFEGVAQIVVAFHDGRELEFWSCTPEDGWAFAVEKDSAREVEVEFRRTSGSEGEAKFQVKWEDGELDVRTER